MEEGDLSADASISTTDAKEYWQSIDADVNGMLGGFPHVSRVDLQGSKNFLAKLGIGGSGQGKGKGYVKLGRAVDCGAGIGRITEGLLLRLAETVDIVEPIAKFTEKLEGRAGVGKVFNVGLEEWSFESGDAGQELRYDLIWNQWCLGHLKDAQLVEYLKKCGEALVADGIIVVKENLAMGAVDIFDDVDSSVTRTENKFKEIFGQADMRIMKTEMQKGMPKELCPIRIWALQPK